VLDVRTFTPLRLGDVLAQRPQRIRLIARLRDRCIERHARIDRVGERLLDLRGER